MMISDLGKLSKVHEINKYTEADLSIYPLFKKAVNLPYYADIIENYLLKEPSFNNRDIILSLLSPNPYANGNKEDEIANDLDKLAAYYSMFETISWCENGITKNISLYNDFSNLKPLTTCTENIEMIFNKSYEEYKLCETNKNKLYFELDGNKSNNAYEIIIPLQYKLSKIEHKKIKKIRDNEFVYKLNKETYVSISSYKSILHTDDIYIGFSRSQNIGYGYKISVAAQFSNGKSPLLPGEMILRFNNIYIKMKYWSSNI